LIGTKNYIYTKDFWQEFSHQLYFLFFVFIFLVCLNIYSTQRSFTWPHGISFCS